MTWKNLFNEQECEETIGRINSLSPQTQAHWGKMTVAQMLAHLNVAYDLAYNDKHVKVTGIKKFIFKLLIKNIVVGPKPYKNNSRTAPVFLISDEREFDVEKEILINNLKKTQQLGASHFNGKESVSFGALTAKEWNTMFSKHLDHHLTQFGA